MKVILINNVNGLGQAGDLCQVKPGYARNYLIPQGLAAEATAEKIRQAQQNQAKKQQQDQKKQNSNQELIDKLTGQNITIESTATPEGKLYGSIGVSELKKAIKEKLGIDIASATIIEPDSIKKTGDHEVVWSFPDNRKVKMTLIIKATN